jgi:hypothetical protein
MRWIAVVVVSLSSGCMGELRAEPADAGPCADAFQWCLGITPGTCGAIVATEPDGAVVIGRVWCPALPK